MRFIISYNADYLEHDKLIEDVEWIPTMILHIIVVIMITPTTLLPHITPRMIIAGWDEVKLKCRNESNFSSI